MQPLWSRNCSSVLQSSLSPTSLRNMTRKCSHRFCGVLSTIIWRLSKFTKRHSANIVALIFMCTGLLLNVAMISITHERVPIDVNTLNDVTFAYTPFYFNSFTFSEVYIGIQNVCFFLLLVFHSEREIIIRRFMFILGIIYYARTVTFSCTQLPTPFDPNVCTEKLSNNLTWTQFSLAIGHRFAKYAATGGFVSKEKTILCGDYIFSGHSLIIIIVYLFINTYFFENKPSRNTGCLVVLKNLHFFLASTAVICVLISRQHYTVDVVFAYYITTRTFWTYHSLCLEPNMFEEIRLTYENDLLNDEESLAGEESSSVGNDGDDGDAAGQPESVVRENPNLIAQVWWWPLFIYMEVIRKPPSVLDKNSILKYQVKRLNYCFMPRCCQSESVDS